MSRPCLQGYPLRVIVSSRRVGNPKDFNCNNRTRRIRVALECGHSFDEHTWSDARLAQLAPGKRTRCQECSKGADDEN